VIGLVLVPFLALALFLAVVFGKTALMESLGSQVGRLFGGVTHMPVVAFLIGSILVTLFYMVPVLGLLTYVLVLVWGMGCAVGALFSSARREMPERPLAPTPPAYAPPSAGSFAPILPPTPPPGASSPAVGPANSAPAPGMPSSSAPPAFPRSLSLPKAGFWERMAAGFLDVVIVLILSAIVGGAPLGFVVALAYFAGMWTWKGTTVGGIVLKLQVVRTDGTPLTFVVALVRGLAAAFSAFVLFLGFLWIAWDRDKQGWHDKIAGTEVIRLPQSPALVCL
jgi:uncharacterized RDD family membrane protein YckC